MLPQGNSRPDRGHFAETVFTRDGARQTTSAPYGPGAESIRRCRAALASDGNESVSLSLEIREHSWLKLIRRGGPNLRQISFGI